MVNNIQINRLFLKIQLINLSLILNSKTPHQNYHKRLSNVLLTLARVNKY